VAVVVGVVLLQETLPYASPLIGMTAHHQRQKRTAAAGARMFRLPPNNSAMLMR